jgi:hypothetical protein
VPKCFLVHAVTSFWDVRWNAVLTASAVVGFSNAGKHANKLVKLLLLVIQLGLEFGNLLVEFPDFTRLCLSTPQQNRGDNVDWRLEFLDLFVP